MKHIFSLVGLWIVMAYGADGAFGRGWANDLSTAKYNAMTACYYYSAYPTTCTVTNYWWE